MILTNCLRGESQGSTGLQAPLFSWEPSLSVHSPGEPEMPLSYPSGHF